MAQQKGKKIPERADKSGFFTARSTPNRAQGQHEADQDGGGDDTLPLQNSPDHGNLPVTQEILRACLDEMSDKLLNKIQASVTALGKDIQELGERTAHVENHMGEYEEAHNDLADHVQALEKQLTSAQLKLSDLEDRSRRQNLRAQGITESVMQADIPKFLTGFFKCLIPDIPTEMILLDRAHLVAKPKFLPAEAARDTLTHLHYYHVKEAILKGARNRTNIPAKYSQLQIYADLSAATLQRRREFKETTETLREHKIPYRWGHPVRLIIQRNGTFTHVTTPEEGLKALKQWDLPVRKQRGRTASPQRLRQDWKKAKK
ncbi:Hypothetical predicted protein [Pelobates cultripes]|uniref:Transposase element L1Md-A101/L1Md-A102/L1Md-A2 n=1 Tax=Pelobates cultripes TaxID=61616 RepID=A0AAD1WM04_PELCU|nr:Hypothetical predicted protein [Pelobates cultripes]